MRSMLRQFRRAPGRILASVLALALAVGAIGVLAIPRISEGTLHRAVERDGLADIIVGTTPLDTEQIAAVGALAGVARAEAQASVAVRTVDGDLTRIIGLGFDDQTMDVVQLTAGTYPAGPDEIVTTPGFGRVGETLQLDGHSLEVVGHGTTLWWSDSDVAFAPLATALEIDGAVGTNRLVVTAVDDGEPTLRSLADEIRAELGAGGDTFTTFPTVLPDGSTPIDADIDQISTLIGLLGVFAGLVALVLLASTTTTLVTERTREVAVMRALGGRSRAMRRRLRRLSTGITGAALVVGLPLGVLISNFIARMVLEEFTGITPDIAIDWRVVVVSAVGALVGARLVSARAARRVVGRPLASALRDRDGAPFGRSAPQRWAARLPMGGLLGKLATRSALHHPSRTLSMTAQIAAAVGAAFLIPSLVTTVNGFNAAAAAPWSWASVSGARDPGLPFRAEEIDRIPGAEAGIWTGGEILDWEVDVFGLPAQPTFFDPMLTDGDWIDAGDRQAVVSAGFAQRTGIEVGERVTVDLAPGAVEYAIVGVSDDSGRAIYVDRADLADDLGAPGMADTIWSDDIDFAAPTDVSTWTDTAAELRADDDAGRDAIVLIFGAIGAIVAGVAALAVLSTMSVNLFERRRELAALQALGARRRRVRGVVLRELLPVALIGTALGLGLGAVGTRAIIGSFESSNAVHIGVVDAFGSVPWIVMGTVAAVSLLAVFMVRSVTRRPAADTLRSAT